MNNKANVTTFKKGHKHSPEVIAKIIASKKGKSHATPSSFKKGMTPWNKGKKTGIIPSTAFKKGRISTTKGRGLGRENELQRHRDEYKLWRSSCFKRDNYTCQKYYISGGRLVVHHINNFADFPELRLALDNGITLSQKAHIEFHKTFGRRNNTKDQLIQFLLDN